MSKMLPNWTNFVPIKSLLNKNVVQARLYKLSSNHHKVNTSMAEPDINLILEIKDNCITLWLICQHELLLLHIKGFSK